MGVWKIRTTKDFIEESKRLYSDRFEYDKTVYTKSAEPVTITCKKHGDFVVKAGLHIHNNCSCPTCARESRRKTVESFIQLAMDKHGERYDYSLVNYVDRETKVCIICRKHGEFMQTPASHISGKGCPKCVKNRSYTYNEFVAESRLVHGDKYTYDEHTYSTVSGKVSCICPKHGEFSVVASDHLKGKGCDVCKKEDCVPNKIHIDNALELIDVSIDKQHVCNITCKCEKHGYITRRLLYANINGMSLSCQKCEKCSRKQTAIDEFIEQSRLIHGNKYDYSKVDNISTKSGVRLLCPKHGEFLVLPHKHLSGIGCHECRYEEMRNENGLRFIEKAKSIHGDKYDYSLVKYVNCNTKVSIICPKHGVVKQRPDRHLSTCGCPTCGNEQMTTDEFIRKAKAVHGDRYMYSNSVYDGYRNKLVITCKKHGDFEQTPDAHLAGHGCYMCKRSVAEEEVYTFLNSLGIQYVEQYTSSWLGAQSLDFFLPRFSIGIECQGIQHYEPVDTFGGEEQFAIQKERDAAKRNKCIENGIRLVEYNNLGIHENDNTETITSLDELGRILLDNVDGM